MHFLRRFVPPPPSPLPPPPPLALLVTASDVYTSNSTPWPNVDGKVSCWWLNRQLIEMRGLSCSDYVHAQGGAKVACLNYPTGRCVAQTVYEAPHPSPPPGPPLPHSLRATPSADSVTAVCLAGQLRTLVYPAQQEFLMERLVMPLQADLFMAVAKAWSRGDLVWKFDAQPNDERF